MKYVLEIVVMIGAVLIIAAMAVVVSVLIKISRDPGSWNQ